MDKVQNNIGNYEHSIKRDSGSHMQVSSSLANLGILQLINSNYLLQQMTTDANKDHE